MPVWQEKHLRAATTAAGVALLVMERRHRHTGRWLSMNWQPTRQNTDRCRRPPISAPATLEGFGSKLVHRGAWPPSLGALSHLTGQRKV
jgi:hypothetical protein